MPNARIDPDRTRTQAEINRAYVERYGLVRKTLLLDGALVERAKAVAAENGVSFTRLVECLLNEAAPPPKRAKKKI